MRLLRLWSRLLGSIRSGRRIRAVLLIGRILLLGRLTLKGISVRILRHVEDPLTIRMRTEGGFYGRTQHVLNTKEQKSGLTSTRIVVQSGRGQNSWEMCALAEFEVQDACAIVSMWN